MGLRNPKHEKLALRIANGERPRDVFRELFPDTPANQIDAALALVLGEPQVRERIRDAQEHVLRESLFDRVWLLALLKRGLQETADNGNWNVFKQLAELAGRIRELDLFPRKIQLRPPDDPFENMETATLMKLAEKHGLLPKPIETKKLPEPEDAQLVEPKH